MNKELCRRRTELLAKGKQRNRELMELSELQQKIIELTQYENVRELEVNIHYFTTFVLFIGWQLARCDSKI